MARLDAPFLNRLKWISPDTNARRRTTLTVFGFTPVSRTIVATSLPSVALSRTFLVIVVLFVQ